MKQKWKIVTLVGIIAVTCGAYTWGIPAAVNIKAHKSFIEKQIKDKTGFVVDIGVKNEELMFLGETDIDIIKDAIADMKPKLVIIDSIQTMYSDEITAAAGSVSQVREITSQIMRMCKAQQITTIIIGHVTKEGNIAGPRVLEHMVDTVLYSDEAQQLIGENGYRPANQDILNRFSDKFDLNIRLWSIEDYGGWNEAYKTYFDDGAMFDEIYGN